ncbi:MAG TPA: imidazole glycerol phosphate synthase subunit HisH [Symbiobacteriaceae bacterium]|jgi:glutamine amidotransferase|nr:imidazole glycerol phosphate synthase subunit HisH [Symbiobacteriaceae bacterium]
MSAAVKIVVVDYDMGNLFSVRNALKAVGYEPVISENPADVQNADGIVLPGMGAFGNGMRKLGERGLIDAVKAFAASGRPVLGICLGMQLLFEYGEEFGAGPGLGLLEGRVTRLPDTVKLPQIGWNVVEPLQTGHPIFEGLDKPYYAYFDHSYAADAMNPADVAATTDYGRVFPCVVARANITGIQFHPEKSSRAGLQMLSNFGRLVCASRSTPQSI